MQPWHKVVIPRKEVREGRSFDPDEFAIHLEQVVAGTAPDDYKDPNQFFSRTHFTRALSEHTGMVLRRLAGETKTTSPVLTLVTQFGGGKTHTLTALYHLANNYKKASGYAGIPELLENARLKEVPPMKPAVFVGNAWDPQDSRETPWIDIARQLAGDDGVQLLGKAAKETPPGTETLGNLFQMVKEPVIVLFDEVLNFMNRHRKLSEPFYAFLQNLTVATTGTTQCVAVVSLPRSRVEMTDWDLAWQEKITKVVRRVAKDLIANDEAEISEVIRARLFDEIGSDRTRRMIAKAYADWCFEYRARLPVEWTAVDTASTEVKAREYLQARFEACYPFHPSTLSVFHRKWQALHQYQQTRGTLAMLAQWVSWAFKEEHKGARREPLITLGSAPLENPDFRGIVLGQLGESRLLSAIDADIASRHSHARALDADTKGPLQDIHRRVANSIFFESSGGQVEKIAHLPELRFALGGPEVDTTSIDNAALALESKSFFIRRIGTDGFKISHKPTLKKVVSDRRASLDDDTEIKPNMRRFIQKEFDRGASIPIIPFPEDGTAVPDSPKLTIALMSPEVKWTGEGENRKNLADWMKNRGTSPRLYPAALIWCLKRPGRDLREKVEMLLAWKRVAIEIREGTLGAEFDPADLTEVKGRVGDAEEMVKDEAWGGYRFIVIYDKGEKDGLRVIDLGAGHASSGETLTGRVLTALKAHGLLNESVGAGYIDRYWPEAFKKTGAWPLASLRQSFLDGSLTRIPDPDTILKSKVVEFVTHGDFGLASKQKSDGTYERVWFKQPITPDEVAFDAGVFLLKQDVAKALTAGEAPPVEPTPPTEPTPEPEPPTGEKPRPGVEKQTIRLSGTIPPELWNRLGTKILPKLRSGEDLSVGVDFSVDVDASQAASIIADLNQILEDLGLRHKIKVEQIQD